jgi:hypothetical protein
MLMNWNILVLGDNLLTTSFNSLITLTLDQSNCMIWVLLFYKFVVILLHIAYGIMSEDAFESNWNLCTFILKISKVNKKGGVMDFDCFPKMTLFEVVGIFLKVAIILNDLPLVREVMCLTKLTIALPFF